MELPVSDSQISLSPGCSSASRVEIPTKDKKGKVAGPPECYFLGSACFQSSLSDVGPLSQSYLIITTVKFNNALTIDMLGTILTNF